MTIFGSTDRPHSRCSKITEVSIINNKAAIYCRLSEEDSDKKNKDDDSVSIQNQKDMLTEYALKQGWCIYNIYSDDDYSGSDRNRPEWNRMIADAKEHKFDIILCKTQSRFTRELEIVEKYIHNLFPLWGIRFVSIVDNIDTNVVGNKKARQINGLINEWYLEDMSDSIKAALHTRMKGGYHIGSFAPYGYRKDPEQKGHLIIDEEEAEVVRTIYSLYTSGIGRTQIARILNERGIPSPSERKKQQRAFTSAHKGGKSQSSLWKYASVSRILTDEVYIGNLVQGTTYNPTYKSKHTVPAPESQWIRAEHTHEAIIDRDTWELTRRIWSERSKPCYVEGSKEINVFAGKPVCIHCGYHMCMGYNRGKRYYRCSTRKFDKNACEGATIFESTLKEKVLEEFKKHLRLYLDETAVENGVTVSHDSRNKLDFLKKSIAEIDRKLAECDTCIKNLYLDKLKGTITQEVFLNLSNQFSADKENLARQRNKMEDEITYYEQVISNTRSKHEIVSQYLNFDELTKPMVDVLIDKIEIGGSRDNRIINIYWNF